MLPTPHAATDSDPVNEFELRAGPDVRLEEELVDRLVAYNKSRSAVVRERFEPAKLKSEPQQVFAVGADGRLLGGDVTTFDFQAPGHTNYFFRKDL